MWVLLQQNQESPNMVIVLAIIGFLIWLVTWIKPPGSGGGSSTNYSDLQDARHWENYKEERYNPNSDDAPRH